MCNALTVFVLYICTWHVYILYHWTIGYCFMVPVQRPIHIRSTLLEKNRLRSRWRRRLSFRYRLWVEKRALDVYITYISTLYTFTITTYNNSCRTFCAVYIIKRYAFYCTHTYSCILYYFQSCSTILYSEMENKTLN